MRSHEDDLHDDVQKHRAEQREEEGEGHVAARIVGLAGGDGDVLEPGAGEQGGKAAKLERFEFRLSSRRRQREAVPVHEEQSETDEEEDRDQLRAAEEVAGECAGTDPAIVERGEAADDRDGDSDLGSGAVQRREEKGEVAAESAGDRPVGEQIRRQSHPPDGDADPATESVSRVEIGSPVPLRPPGGLAEAEAHQKADSADREPGCPGEPAGVAEDLRGKEEDASPDDAVDSEPDAVEQRHAVSGGHLPVTMPQGQASSQAGQRAAPSLDSESFPSMMRHSFRGQHPVFPAAAGISRRRLR